MNHCIHCGAVGTHSSNECLWRPRPQSTGLPTPYCNDRCAGESCVHRQVVRPSEKLALAASHLRQSVLAARDELHGSDDWHGIGTGYRHGVRRLIRQMSPQVAYAMAGVLFAEAEVVKRHEEGIIPAPDALRSIDALLVLADQIIAEHEAMYEEGVLR